MSLEEDNSLKISLLHELDVMITLNSEIQKNFNLSSDYFEKLTQNIPKIINNKLIFKNNSIEEFKKINSTISSIISIVFSFKSDLDETSLNFLNYLEKGDLKHKFNEISTTLDVIKEKTSLLNKKLYNAIQNKDKNVIINGDKITLTNEFTNFINEICDFTSNLLDSLKYTINLIESTKKSINIQKNIINEKHISNYINMFNEDKNLIIKKFDNEIKDITKKIENQFKNFQLDYDEINKSNQLLTNEVDSSLKKLTDLNERTQKIELEFSKIIGSETENVKEDLNLSRITLMGVIDSITTEANTKLNEIKNAHTDFINLVSNAGIYKLTENYDKKAKEEKQQYETYRTYTGRAIGAAIAFTIIILAIPLIEYWGANPPVDTNYYTILARLTISLMFFVLALYFSKQASKHYECYQENHRTFLQLAALEPFMARMTPEEQKEIRKSLVPSYFNQGTDGKFASNGDEVDMAMMFTFMDKLSNFGQNKKDIKPGESAVAENKPQV